MKDCWVSIYSVGYVAYWLGQEPKPRVVEKWLVWAGHKFEKGYCVRCGQRERS